MLITQAYHLLRITFTQKLKLIQHEVLIQPQLNYILTFIAKLK